MEKEKIEACRREGRQHAICNHPDPEEMTAEEKAAYEQGRQEGLADWSAHDQGQETKY